MNNKIFIKKENQLKEALVLTTFDIGNDKYCIYAIPSDNKRNNIYCDKLIDDNLVAITDDKELELIRNIVDKLLKPVKNLEL